MNLGKKLAETLVWILLSGPDGISCPELAECLMHADPYQPRVSDNALERRVTDLRKKGIRIPHRTVAGQDTYCLDPAVPVRSDAVEFVRGVTELSDDPPVQRLDELMALWRGRPWPGQDPPSASPWAKVLTARARLLARIAALPDDQRDASTQLRRFLGLFHGEHGLDTSALLVRRRKPRLLVVEDTIIDEICALLDSEFVFERVTALAEWNAVRDSLDVDGALIDRHLADFTDDQGTTVIAEYLRRYTEIPASLMTVAPPPNYRSQTDFRHRHRLLEIVHKGYGRLEEKALVDAAHGLVDPRSPAERERLRLWVESDRFHVDEEHLFSRRSRAARERAELCGRQADSLLSRLGSMHIDDAKEKVRDFHDRWGPRAAATW